MSLYQICAPRVPGAQPETYPVDGTLAEVRELATERYGARRDLLRLNVRIERRDGQLVEYAGPPR